MQQQSKITDVAKRAGVGIATVSRVLNDSGYVSEKTRKKVLEAVEYYHYQPNLVAKSLVQKSTRLIGVVISDILNPFYSQLIRVIQNTCDENNYAIILCNTDEQVEKEKKYLNILINNRVDAIIMAGGRGSGSTYNRHLCEIAQKIPLVLANELLEGEGIYCVYCNKEEGAYRMTEYLIGLGHRDIVHIAGYPDFKPTHDRLTGFVRAMKAHDLQVGEESVIYSDYHVSGGYQTGCDLMRRPKMPTAVFASNDLMAIGAIKAFQEKGIGVPDQITVVGSDNILFNEFLTPSLTTISHRAEELGRESVLSAISLINGEPVESCKILKMELVIRNSSGKPHH